MEQQYCQSCGMPMKENDELYGEEKDGSKSKDYCVYCYDKGSFKTDETMEQMIESCIPHMVKGNPSMTEQIAREIMEQALPNLKRWKR